MFNHGLSTAALFLVTGFLIKRRGSRMISDYGGVEKVAPVLAGLFLVAGLSALSLPGLSPFVSEFLVLVGTFVHSPWAASFAVLGIVLAAIYILLMYQRTMTGPVREGVAGMRRPERRARSPRWRRCSLLIVVLGFFPKPLLDVINPTVDHTMSQVGKSDPPTGRDRRGGARSERASTPRTIEYVQLSPMLIVFGVAVARRARRGVRPARAVATSSRSCSRCSA